jgi:hypothetical protein
MNDILKLLASVPPSVVAEILNLVRAVLSSDDPARTARRHAKMVAARNASAAYLRRVLGK